MKQRKRPGAGVRVCAMLVGLVFAAAVGAAGKPPNVSAGGTMGDILAKLDEINAKLDKLEKRLGCPIDEYVAGTCTDNPASTSVTYCIHQGRSGELAGKWAVEGKAKVEAGGRWDVVGLADLHGEANVPLTPTIGPIPIPLPTELALGGSASLGRGFDICVQVPLTAAQTDASILESIVKGMNPPSADTKYQRRLHRVLNYANLRVPNPVATKSATVASPGVDDLDFDRADDAVERFMVGDFKLGDGPLGILKDPIVADLRDSLELPALLQLLLQDPDGVLGMLPDVDFANPGQMCGSLGLSGSIASRAPVIGKVCGRLANLPTFDSVSTAFDAVHEVDSLVRDIPDAVILGVGDILTSVNSAKLPAPRPAGSTVCNIFPRLCQ
ncbi:MAG: hypothetical protein ACM3JC_08290 [Rudaea sp.]